MSSKLKMANKGIHHPLDSLTADEIKQVVSIVRNSDYFTERMRFISITLNEPTKEEVSKFTGNDAILREAFVIILDNEKEATYEVIVSISNHEVHEIRHIPGVQPAIVLDEMDELHALVTTDPAVQAALRKRGITKFDLFEVGPLSAGNYGEALEQTHRLIRSSIAYRLDEDDNSEAHPIDGLHVIVDLNKMKVLRIEDYDLIPVPSERADYVATRVPNQRQDLKKLDIVQPDGVSFEVNGSEVSWQKWRFRVGFNHREGLVLYKIAYEDGDRVRPLIYRASMVEMTVPYADPSITQYRRNYFDAGEYGMGMMTNSLELGCDCLGKIHYFDAHLSNSKGEVVKLKNAICLHEEDFSILWKHYGEVRRSRRLVISFIATVGNYDYGFYWYFYQDGTIEFEVKLTGLLATAAVHPGETTRYGTMLGDALYAPNHQHFFCVRMDMEIDGPNNSVVEVNTVADPTGPDNPFGNAFYTQETTLKSEQEAQRIIAPLAGRYWQISNPNSKNKIGQPVGYKLWPGDNILPFARPESSIAKRGGYMWKHLWVTPYHPDEMFPAGAYPNQHPGGAGLPKWTKADRSVENTDIVVWYVMGCHHVPRLEDWPIMPVAKIGFTLKASGFFDQNPSLDVPPNHADHCHSEIQSGP
jgi:primary-amine oxidase